MLKKFKFDTYYVPPPLNKKCVKLVLRESVKMLCLKEHAVVTFIKKYKFINEAAKFALFNKFDFSRLV